MAYGTVQADVIQSSVANTSLGAGNASIMKNRIINGAMYVAQKGTSATITAGAALNYATVDRFYGYCTGANVTMAQVAGSGNNRNLLQFTGAASVTAIGVGQRIEAVNSYDMAGSTATLSAYIANSLLTSVTWTAYYANTTDTFGTLASPTRTQIATGTFTVTSTLTQYNAQISIPSAATTGIEIVFTVGAQTSGTWQLGLVQLEVGSSATGYEYRQYGQELALCQRYYYKTTQPNINNSFGSAFSSTTTVAYSTFTFPVTLRTSPTALEQNGTAANYGVFMGGTGTTCSSVPAFAYSNTDNALITFTVAAGLTVGTAGYAKGLNTGAYLAWSAEL